MVDRGRFNDMKALDYLDARIKSQAPMNKFTPMAEDFSPDSWTVICGRGKSCYNHPGNQRFRLLCEVRKDKYEAAKSKFEKSIIVMEIVDIIREGSQSGGFVRLDSKTQQWHEVGDSTAREKVGQQLRDCLKASAGFGRAASNQMKTSLAQQRRHADLCASPSTRGQFFHQKQTNQSNAFLGEKSDSSELLDRVPMPPPLVSLPSEHLAHWLRSVLSDKMNEGALSEEKEADEGMFVPPSLCSVPSDQVSTLDFVPVL